MQGELHVNELEFEVCMALPERNLMRRHRHHGGGAHASFGSAANSNVTHQSNSNGQFVVNTGSVRSGGIRVDSHNSNSNSNTQTALPINFGL